MPELPSTVPARFSAADLQIVIPTRDRWPILARTLDALSTQTVEGFGVTVVVDGTDQDVAELDTTGFGEMNVIVKPHGGPGAARNAGVAASDRPLVLFLGDDMIPAPQLVERHLARHNLDPATTAAVLGLSVWHPDVAGGRIHRWLDWSATQFDYVNIEGDDAGWGRFYSSNVSLKRDLFVQTGGFDEDFTYYYEDLDLAWRLHEKGLQLWLERDALAHHLHRIEWPDVVRRFQGIARGEYLMARKHAWFTPYFKQRIESAAKHPPVPAWWPRLADVPGPLQKRARRMANRRYYQRLAPLFGDAWDGERDLEELRTYTGASYDHDRLVHHAHSVADELETVGDEATLYRTSEAYLYDLTAFAMSGAKLPYRADLQEVVPPPAKLLDWGCGIGADGLRLIDQGYDVAFVDFDNPSTRYLRWRLTHRGIDAPVYDLDTDTIPSGFDAAYAFDVIEHVDDPFAMLDAMEQRAAVVMVNLLEEEAEPEHPHHRQLPIAAILEHVRERGLIRYRTYHGGRSHLVAYRGRA